MNVNKIATINSIVTSNKKLESLTLLLIFPLKAYRKCSRNCIKTARNNKKRKQEKLKKKKKNWRDSAQFRDNIMQ